MKLIYKQGNYGSICFPYKKSCEFATKKCLKECSEQFEDMAWFNEVFTLFKNQSSIELYAEIKKELEDNNYKLLTWFDCGDCPSRMTNKIYDIINQLRKDGFVQLGFTRNNSLWQKLTELDNSKVRFLLTVEKGTKLIKEGEKIDLCYNFGLKKLLFYIFFSKFMRSHLYKFGECCIKC